MLMVVIATPFAAVFRLLEVKAYLCEVDPMLDVELLDPGLRSPVVSVLLHLLEDAPHLVLEAGSVTPLVSL